MFIFTFSFGNCIHGVFVSVSLSQTALEQYEGRNSVFLSLLDDKSLIAIYARVILQQCFTTELSPSW